MQAAHSCCGPQDILSAASLGVVCLQHLLAAQVVHWATHVFAGNAQSSAVEQAVAPVADIALSIILTMLMQPSKLLTL